MRERRALRFVVEALFLGALAAALVVADQGALVIAGVMLLGWLVVALYEWAATRELPHYGRGLPPRYYVPQVSLPPPRQLEQLRPAQRSGYPAPSPDDQATWIASPAMRAEALAGWPLDPVDEVGVAATAAAPGEDTMVVDNLLLVAAAEEFHEDTWIELDPIAEGRGRDEVVAVAIVESEVVEPPEPAEEVAALVVPIAEVAEVEAVGQSETAAEPEPVPVEAAAPVVEEEPALESEPSVASAVGPDVVAAAPIEPLAVPDEPVLEDAEVEHDASEEVESDAPVGLEPVVAAAVVAETEGVPEVAEVLEPEVVGELDPAVLFAAAAAGAVVADHEAFVESRPDDGAEPEPGGADVDGPRSDGADEHEAAAIVAMAAAVVVAPDAPVESEPDDDTEEDAAPSVVAAPVPEPPARHTFDPLPDDSQPRRRWRRRDDPYVELPARPPRPTALPGASRHEL